ncbi:hypothetical protein BDK51DRAFT_21401, partial [Blyttiomyces helicus]
WETVIPQLLARLDHPEPFVRRQLTILICRIGAASPHLVVYHAVVESQPDSSQQAETSASYSRDAYHQILASLQQTGSATLVSQVQKMIFELQRATVLWEEMWLNKLTHLQNDVAKRIDRFDADSARIFANGKLSDRERNTLAKTGRVSIVAPIVRAIEAMCAMTTRAEPGTPHEKWFHATYKVPIEEALAALAGSGDLKEAWKMFKQVCVCFVDSGPFALMSMAC